MGICRSLDPRLTCLSSFPRSSGRGRPRCKARTNFSTISKTKRPPQDEQQLNLSVLRFTFGIPGLDESYLPRWIGYGFGSLLVLNHFLGYNPAASQLRTEAVGLSLAAFSVSLPYLGKFLKGAVTTEQATLPEGAEQIFLLSANLRDFEEENLAWVSYALLRCTNTIAVLIVARGAMCIRGYWNIPANVSKENRTSWFQSQIETTGLSEIKDSRYFPRPEDSRLWDIVPMGTRSILVEPVVQAINQNADPSESPEGFVLLASSLSYAFSDEDRAWIRSIANRFSGSWRRESLNSSKTRTALYKNFSNP